MPHPRVSIASVSTQITLNIKAVLADYVRVHEHLAYREQHIYHNSETGTTITLYGHTSLAHAHARYEGYHGTWEILLSDGYGKLGRKASLEDIKKHRINHVCGKPWRTN